MTNTKTEVVQTGPWDTVDFCTISFIQFMLVHLLLLSVCILTLAFVLRLKCISPQLYKLMK